MGDWEHIKLSQWAFEKAADGAYKEVDLADLLQEASTIRKRVLAGLPERETCDPAEGLPEFPDTP